MRKIRKVGLEIEYNRNERDELKNAHPYILGSYTENEIISEKNIKPVKLGNIRNFCRRFLLVTEVFCPDFRYRYGAQDDWAESNHLHLEVEKEWVESNWDEVQIILSQFLPLFSRYNEEFRDRVTEENGRANVKFVDWLPCDSKEYWVTWNDGPDTLEIRVNENPSPLFIPLLDFAFYVYEEGILDIEEYMFVDLSDFYDSRSYRFFFHDVLNNFPQALENYIANAGYSSQKVLRLIFDAYREELDPVEGFKKDTNLRVFQKMLSWFNENDKIWPQIRKEAFENFIE